MKTYGSAVLTALQAQHASIEEVKELIRERQRQAVLEDGNSEEWLDCFWKQMAILEAQRCRKKITEKNLRKIFSINVKTCKSVIVIVLQ